MPRFTDSKVRDPFRNFNFHILIGGVEVAACKKMSKISSAVEVVKFRAGNDASSAPELLPGRVSCDPVTLEAGLTNDASFKDWAKTLHVNGFTGTSRKRAPDFRKEVEIQVFDLDSKTKVKSFKLHNAWVSKYQAVSDLSGDANEVIIETIEIQHEGFTEE